MDEGLDSLMCSVWTKSGVKKQAVKWGSTSSNRTQQGVRYSGSRALHPPKKEQVLTKDVVKGSGILISILIIRHYYILIQIQPEFQGSFHVIEGLELCCWSQL